MTARKAKATAKAKAKARATATKGLFHCLASVALSREIPSRSN
jgi:hypothetical protein